MIPLKDENPTKHFPFLTITLIGANIFIFIYGLGMPMELPYFYNQYGLIPPS